MDVLGLYLTVQIGLLALFPKLAGRWWADFKIGYGARMNE